MYYVKQVIFYFYWRGEVLLYHASLYICNLYGLLCSVEKTYSIFFQEMFLLLAFLLLIMYNIKVAKTLLFIFKKQLIVDQSFFNLLLINLLLLLIFIWFYHRFYHRFV